MEASITIDGTLINSVGIRLKGNSTLRGLGGGGGRAGGGMGGNVSADNPDSLPWLISFDEYVKGQRYQGYKEIAIRPVLTNKTMINEALALSVIGLAGQPTQQTTYTALRLNGGAAALRLVLEIPGDNYGDDNFDTAGVLYKALSTGKFTYLGDDPLAYQNAFKQITRKNQQDIQPLIGLLQWVNTASDAEFAANLDQYVEVDALARYIALQSLLNNFDDMSGPGQNYYLWYDLETGKFSVLTWDMNLAFGQGGFGGNRGAVGAPTQIQNGQAPAAGQAPFGGQGQAGQQPGRTQGAGGQMPNGQMPPNGQLPANGQAPAGNVVIGGAGGLGGNVLKSRFLAAPAFQDRYKRAYAEMYQALYGSGTALAELDRLAAVLKTTATIPAATVESEIAALRAIINTQTAAGATK